MEHDEKLRTAAEEFQRRGNAYNGTTPVGTIPKDPLVGAPGIGYEVAPTANWQQKETGPKTPYLNVGAMIDRRVEELNRQAYELMQLRAALPTGLETFSPGAARALFRLLQMAAQRNM